MTKRIGGSSAALFLLLAPGCGGSDKPKGDPCDFQFGTGGPVAQFNREVACAPNPWPSDRMRNGTGLTVPPERVSYMLPPDASFDEAREYLDYTRSTLDNDGWSTISPLRILFDSPVDLDTVGEGVFFFRFDGNTPVADATELEARWDDDLNALLLQPRTPLLEGTTYGVVVTADLLDDAGRPTARAREFQEYLAAPEDAVPADLTLYEDSGHPTDRIALAFTFTTATNTDDLLSIRDWLFSNPDGEHDLDYETGTFGTTILGHHLSGSPEFTTSLGTITTGSNLAAIVNGSFDAFDFRGTDGAFDEDLVDGSVTPPTNRIDFRLTIPDGTPPAEGWRVVVYGHGLGGSNGDVYRWGNLLAPYGFAVIGISALEHGYRGSPEYFFDWSSLPATRENFRQTNADHLQLLRALRDANAAALAPFDELDVDDVSYFGISLGGILGSSFLSLNQHGDRGLLVVPGGQLSRVIYAETVGQGYFYPFLQNATGLSASSPEFLLFLKGFEPLVQLGMDAADPVNYARRVVTPGAQFPDTPAKAVLQTISIGDTWVPNDTNEALQRALGIPTLTQGSSGGSAISGAWVFEETDFPDLGDEPHSWFSELCQAQVMGFTWLDTSATELLDPATIACP